MQCYGRAADTAALQVYFSTTPLKVYNLRPDTLAVMTCLADIGPHARVLCMDATGGIVAAACAERMGGTGTLACVHAERTPYVLDAVRLLNIARWLPPSARSIALTDLLAAHAAAATAAPAAVTSADAPPGGAAAGAPADSDMADDTPANALGGDVPAQRNSGNAQLDTLNPADGPGKTPEASEHATADAADAAAEQDGSRAGGGRHGHKTVFRMHVPVGESIRVPDAVIAATEAEVAEIAAAGFTSLVVAAPRLEAARLLQAVQSLLLPSASFVVFSPSLQPLAECFQALQETREFASLQVRLPRLRVRCRRHASHAWHMSASPGVMLARTPFPACAAASDLGMCARDPSGRAVPPGSSSTCSFPHGLTAPWRREVSLRACAARSASQ